MCPGAEKSKLYSIVLFIAYLQINWQRLVQIFDGEFLADYAFSRRTNVAHIAILSQLFA